MTDSGEIEDSGEADGGCKIKVNRLLREYDLPELGDELVVRWTREEDRWSLRQLADFFNRELLRAELSNRGSDLIDGEVENLYRLLTDDEATSGDRQEAESRLRRRGIDVETIEEDFVSYQAIRTYLRRARDVSPPEETRTAGSHRETKRTTIQQLSTRLRKVTETSILELTNAGDLSIGDFDVTVTVRVHCRRCDTRMTAVELLSKNECQCET